MKAENCKPAVADLHGGQRLPAQPSPQLLAEAEFSGSQELSGSWEPLTCTKAKCHKLFPDPREAVRPCVSPGEIWPLREATAPLLPVFHYLEFRQNQEQLDFTQPHKLTVLCRVTPSVFLKILLLMQRSETMLWSFCNPFQLRHHLLHYFAMHLLPRCTV